MTLTHRNLASAPARPQRSEDAVQRSVSIAERAYKPGQGRSAPSSFAAGVAATLTARPVRAM